MVSLALGFTGIRQGGSGLSRGSIESAAGCEVRVVICAAGCEVRVVGGSIMELGKLIDAGRGRRKGSESLVLVQEGLERVIVIEVRAYCGGGRLVGRKYCGGDSVDGAN